nr:uncharacterized protein LOC27206978 isoform X3 [Drosophila simulans]
MRRRCRAVVECIPDNVCEAQIDARVETASSGIQTIEQAGWNSLHSKSLCVNMAEQPRENNNSATYARQPLWTLQECNESLFLEVEPNRYGHVRQYECLHLRNK